MATTETNYVIRGHDKTKTAFASVRGGMTSLASTAAKVGTGVGLAMTAAAVAIGVIGQRSLESADRMQKLGQTLGVATETLSRLKQASDFAGGSLESTAKGFKKMQENVSDAANGIGTAKDSINDLGLSATALKSQKPEEAFLAIVQGLAGVSNQADRMRIATDIFGRAAEDIIRFSADGADGLRSMFAEADRLGTVLSQVDANNIAEANDQFTRMGAVISGAAQTLTGVLAPSLAAIGEFGTNQMVRLVNAIKTNKDQIIDFAKNGVLKLVDAFKFVVSVSGTVSAAFRAVQVAGLQGFGFLIEGVRSFNNVLLQAGAISFETFKQINEAAFNFRQDNLNAIASIKKAAEESKLSFDVLEGGIADFKSSLGNALNTIKTASDKSKTFGQTLKEAVDDASAGAVGLTSNLVGVASVADRAAVAISRLSDFSPSRLPVIGGFTSITPSIFDSGRNSIDSGSRTVTRTITGPRTQITQASPVQSAPVNHVNVYLQSVTLNGTVDARAAEFFADALAPALKRRLQTSF